MKKRTFHPLFPYPMTKLYFLLNVAAMFLVLFVYTFFDISIYQNWMTATVAIVSACYMINVVFYRLEYLGINRGYTLSLFLPVINVLLVIYLLVRNEPVS